MKYVLVTGASGGIGKEICHTFLKKNYTVFACDLNTSTLSASKNLIPINMDITNEQMIMEAKEQILKVTNYIDIIINCAGILKMASLIENDVEDTIKVVNVNLFGAMRVNKVLFPLLKEKTGRIINITSETGWLSPAPFNGPYTISKYALEAYNDSLRRELNFLGIKVIKIEPGSFKTKMHNKTLETFESLKQTTKYYAKVLNKMGKMMNKELENANDLKYLMEAIVKAAESKNPNLCYRVKNSKSLMFINHFSEKTIDKIYLKSLKEGK